MGDRLAIVGSTQFKGDIPASRWAWAEIAAEVSRLSPEVIISGGAPGIDTLADLYADAAGIPFVPHLPKNKRWKPDGFADRNLLIAEDCTHLLAIRHPKSKTYGSGWTADRAEEMGRSVRRVTLPLDTTVPDV